MRHKFKKTPGQYYKQLSFQKMIEFFGGWFEQPTKTHNAMCWNSPGWGHSTPAPKGALLDKPHRYIICQCCGVMIVMENGKLKYNGLDVSEEGINAAGAPVEASKNASPNRFLHGIWFGEHQDAATLVSRLPAPENGPVKIESFEIRDGDEVYSFAWIDE